MQYYCTTALLRRGWSTNSEFIGMHIYIHTPEFIHTVQLTPTTRGDRSKNHAFDFVHERSRGGLLVSTVSGRNPSRNATLTLPPRIFFLPTSLHLLHDTTAFRCLVQLARTRTVEKSTVYYATSNGIRSTLSAHTVSSPEPPRTSRIIAFLNGQWSMFNGAHSTHPASPAILILNEPFRNCT